MVACAATAGTHFAMTTNSDSDGRPTGSRRNSNFRNVMLSVILLAGLLLSAVFRDMRLPVGPLGVCRDFISATVDVSDQYLWCGALAIYIMFFAFWNIRTFRP